MCGTVRKSPHNQVFREVISNHQAVNFVPIEQVGAQSVCKVLKWGIFRLPAYVANVTKVFAKFSGCNTHLLVGFYCLYVGEA